VRIVRIALLLALALSAQACLVVSLQPIYDPDTLAFEPALTGTWVNEDGVTVDVERAEWHSYHLSLSDNGKTTRLSARLTRVGDLQLLDVTPLDGVDIDPLQLPVHGIFRVALDEDALRISSLDYDHFFAMAAHPQTEVDLVTDARKNVILTGSTAGLRHWVQDHATDEGLFAPPAVWKRKNP
jgi:hypothetical protein